MAGYLANHYFSPRSFVTTDHARESFWIPVQTYRCRRWRPANFRGRSVSSALPCISFRIRAKGAAGTFQRGKFPNQISSRKHASLQLNCRSSTHTTAENPQHTASLDELAEPNYYSKCAETSSTRLFASHFPDKSESADLEELMQIHGRACLIPAPASKLQVFQIIQQIVLHAVRRMTARFEEGAWVGSGRAVCVGRY